MLSPSIRGAARDRLTEEFLGLCYTLLCSTEYFPLTLTLSLGEREQPPPGLCLAHTGLANSVAGMPQKRRTILPLPRGEGRSDGKETVAHPTVSSLSPRASLSRRLPLKA